MKICEFFDDATYTLTYVVYDERTNDAVIIDPVLDFDPPSGAITKKSMATLVAFVREKQLRVHLILETHAHADHLSSSHFLVKEVFPDAKVGIGKNITMVQKTFSRIFNLPPTFRTDGSQFDRLFSDGDIVSAGSLKFKVLLTPGHTPACASYVFGDAVFTGDCLFMPDSGTGRCDFPDGNARALYHSVAKVLYTLPDSTRIFVGHDYQPGGRKLAFETTVGQSKTDNIHIKATTTEDEFVEFRMARDKTLSAPRLLLPSIQVNIAAGHLPAPESNGTSYLKLPIKV